jgi:hypothetical protein
MSTVFCDFSYHTILLEHPSFMLLKQLKKQKYYEHFRQKSKLQTL